ncbi:hypothetical protein LSTR_LSTR000447 [Laodelphax striatellus]|uniref:alpha-1,2-Mannosidase n=1 Tax=Laodelphax striatellus TaxID=195883 RepID=A0A482X1S9_LAOST|nr:hypothetical protein LSTR_LSTR000447 [Laodelphax striatellus]
MHYFKSGFYIFYISSFLFYLSGNEGIGIRKYDKKELYALREEVREMFDHAYSSYLQYAYPYDELRPLTCDGMDTWGSYSLTLIDALDSLVVMGNYSEFQRVYEIVTTKANFDSNINVSVFETNIRIVGGLLSAHLLSQRAGVAVEPGWPCNGPLLRLAEDVAKRLIAAFDTTTGMPYGTVNLRSGVPPGETSVTCTAGVGTFILEFGTLSRLTGDPVYEEVALNAIDALYKHQSAIGLVGNHIDVLTGRWTAQDSGIGAGVDSYFEYLVKGAILLHRPELMAMFNEIRASIDKYLKRADWYLWVSMHKGQVTLPVFQSLEAYWPGVLSLIGDINAGMKSMHNYYQVWKQYGFTPEFYNIPQAEVGLNRQSYPLRPELAESAMYLYRATGDPFLLDIGVHILRSIQHSAYTPCGYATIEDTRDHTKENRMESFFLAETTKYLYLLFDPDNFIHNKGQHGTIHTLPSGKEIKLGKLFLTQLLAHRDCLGMKVFTSKRKAHPLDPGALLCCSESREEQISQNKKQGDSRGERWKTSAQQSEEKTPLNTQSQTDELKKFVEETEKSKVVLESAIELEQKSADGKVSSHVVNAADSQISEETANMLVKEMINYLRLVEKSVNLLKENLSSLDIGSGTTPLDKVSMVWLKNFEENKVSLKKLLSNNLERNHDGGIFKDEKFVSFLLKTLINNSVMLMNLASKDDDVGSLELDNAESFDDRLAHFRKIHKKLFAVYSELYEKVHLGDKNEVDEKSNLETENVTSDDDIPVTRLLDTESNDSSFASLENWKSDDILYQVDDREKVSPVSRSDASPMFTDRIDASSESSVTVPEFVSQFLVSSASEGPEFDPQRLLERIRTGPGYKRNASWLDNYELLSCRPQPFYTRISLSGEFFNPN